MEAQMKMAMEQMNKERLQMQEMMQGMQQKMAKEKQ